jgi:hypothetical protein
MSLGVFFSAIRLVLAFIIASFGIPVPHVAPAAPAAHLTFPGGSVPARVVHVDETGSYVLADHLTRTLPAEELAVAVGSHTYPSSGTDCNGAGYCLVHIWPRTAADSTEEDLPAAVESGLEEQHDSAVAALADIPSSAPEADAAKALNAQQAKLNDQYDTEAPRDWTLSDVEKLAKTLPPPANNVPIHIASKAEAKDAGENTDAWVYDDEVAIYLAPDTLKDAYASDLRGTLLHESMHVIQNTKDDGYRTLHAIAGNLKPEYKKELADPSDPHLPMDEAVASCAEPAMNADYLSKDCTYGEELKIYDWISSTEGPATADQWWPYLVWATEDTLQVSGYSHPIYPTPAMVRTTSRAGSE